MSEIQRYDFSSDGHYPSNSGGWVDADEAEAKIKQLEQELAAAKASQAQQESNLFSQSGKYDIENGRLVNAATRKPIPSHVPVFILIGNDVHARETIQFYRDKCEDVIQKTAVGAQLTAFVNYFNSYSHNIKQPDSELPPASQAQQSQWISVEERLPEENCHALVACEGGNVATTFYAIDHSFFDHAHGHKLSRKKHGKYSKHFELARQYGYRITHWMPLPPAPEGGE